MADLPPLRAVPFSLPRLLSLARPKHWLKNSFVLAPLLFSVKFLNPGSVGAALFAVALFCGASSVVYTINDIYDTDKDRAHPEKSLTRPLAAGEVTLSAGLTLMAVLAGATVVGGILLPKVLAVIALYVGLNLAYTLFIKGQPIIDVFAVALGYVLRVYAGALAIDVPVSDWMFVTTLCLALYLTFLKRRQELDQRGSGARRVLERYSVALLDRYAEMSATATLVFYSIYVVTTKPQLVLTVPLVMFGLFRYWYVVDQRAGGESPTDVVLTDPWLLATSSAWISGCVWALWPVT